MINVSKFVKEFIPLGIYAPLGIATLAILGYLGYHAVRWIIHKCSKTEKTDAVFRSIIDSFPIKFSTKKDLSKDCWWTRITKSTAYENFKKDWKNLAKSARARDGVVEKLSSYYQGNNTGPRNQFIYSEPLGTVYGVPNDFSMWMPGVALVGAYLAEKKKIEGLYVCETLESFSSQINKINSNPANQRYAFILPTFQSGFKNNFPFAFEPNFPQHKVTVCVEKKDGQLTIALLDADPVPEHNKDILPENLKDNLWSGYEEWNRFNCQELVFRAILKSCRDSNCQARLLHSQVLRQKSYGCGVFALQDAVAYLQDHNFFSRITCSKEQIVKIDQKYEIEVITTLPPEYMIGTQSTKIIDEYKDQGGEFNTILIGKKKTLQKYLDKYLIEVTDEKGEKKMQNHYITKKSFCYLKFVCLALQHFKAPEIEKIMSKNLITQEFVNSPV
jgi:hypothetical protein